MQIVFFTALAGVCGTGLGGVLTVLLGNRSTSMTGWLLSFAAGIMIGVVCFGLIPEATGIGGIYYTIGGVIGGIIIIMALNRIADNITEAQTNKKIHETQEELYHASPILSGGNSKLFRSGIIMLFAIALHNIPEGLAIGAAGSHDAQLGLTLAIIIALHNIPEGMAIAAPLFSGGMKKSKVIGLAALAGAPTLIGGAVGLLVGKISDVAISLSLAAAGGAMLYVVFGEIIPQVIVNSKSRLSTIITLFGIIIGLIVTQI